MNKTISVLSPTDRVVRVFVVCDYIPVVGGGTINIEHVLCFVVCLMYMYHLFPETSPLDIDEWNKNIAFDRISILHYSSRTVSLHVKYGLL